MMATPLTLSDDQQGPSAYIERPQSAPSGGRTAGQVAPRLGLDREAAADVIGHAIAAMSEQQSSWRPTQLNREIGAATPTDLAIAAADLVDWPPPSSPSRPHSPTPAPGGWCSSVTPSSSRPSVEAACSGSWSTRSRRSNSSGSIASSRPGNVRPAPDCAPNPHDVAPVGGWLAQGSSRRTASNTCAACRDVALNELDGSARQACLLPRTNAGRDERRPEDEQADTTGRGLVRPFRPAILDDETAVVPAQLEGHGRARADVLDPLGSRTRLDEKTVSAPPLLDFHVLRLKPPGEVRTQPI
jgi:hypothetical protein